MRIPWLTRKPDDPVEGRARGLVEHADRSVANELPTLVSRFPDLAAADPLCWRRHATVSVAKLAVFPLLRAVEGDPDRFNRILALIRRDLNVRFPKDEPLWAESDRATIPPSGHERTKTLQEVDEAQALALARWALNGVVGAEGVHGRWEAAQAVAGTFRRIIDGYWRR